LKTGVNSGASRKTKTMKKRYLIGGAVLLAAVILLVYAGLQCFGVYMVSVDEFLAGDIDYDTSVRVAGQVADGSLAWDADAVELRFTVTYGTASMPVLYRGARPSGLQNGSGVVLEGKYLPEGVFEADQIILKCASKYEALVE